MQICPQRKHVALLSLKGPVQDHYHPAQGMLEGKDETKVGW